MSESGKRWGIAAGTAAMMGAVSIGWIAWQGMVFDQFLEDAARILSDEGATVGLSVRVEETERGFRYRDLAVTLEKDDLLLRWMGRADFGFSSHVVLGFDHTYGVAPRLAELGFDGPEVRLNVHSGWPSSSPVYEWTVKPFRVSENDVLCNVGGLTVKLSDNFRTFVSDWSGLSCRARDEWLEIGPLTVSAVDAQGRSDVMFKGGTMTSRTPEGTLKVDGYVLRTSRMPVLDVETSDPSPWAARCFNQTWAWTVDGLSVDERLLFKQWMGKFRFLNAPDMLLTAIAFGSAEDIDRTAAYVRDLLTSGAIRAELDECRFLREDGEASVVGRLAKDQTRLGAWAVRIDSTFAAKEPLWRDNVEVFLSQGLLRETEGKLTAHVELTEERLLINGMPF